MADLAATLSLNALSAILILSLVALGLAVIFGLMGVINLAHGAFLTVGAYVAWFVTSELGISFWLSLILAPIIVGLLGALVERFVVRYLYHRLLDTILATWGISLALIEIVKLAFGTTSKSVDNPIGGGIDLGITVYPTYRLLLMGLCIVILVAVFAFFKSTDFGVRIRAVIQDPDAAGLQGLNKTRMYQFSFSFGSALAGLAGAAVAPITTVEPNMGVSYLLDSFFAVILGGTGALIAVIPGSIIVAGSTNLMTYAISPVVAQTIVYALVIIVMIIRPAGIVPEAWHE
jgi:branched-chain amino acid transport system permease protein/urea transport system permease protein